MKLKVVYFTILRIDADFNGGTICCRNHIKRLSNDTGIELFVVVAGYQNQEADSLAYLNRLGISGKFIIFQGQETEEQMTLIQKLTSIPFKNFARNQTHIDQAVVDAIITNRADLLFIDFLFSALFCPKAIKVVPRVTLATHNRETEIYWDFLKTVTKSRFKMVMKSMRLVHMWFAEQSILRSMDKIIALSPPDVPKRNGIYITPYLDKKTQQWKPNSSRTIFFVGHIGHPPNRKAIEYIITKLAPAITAILPDVQFKIMGADAADVSFHHYSVDLLGYSDEHELEKQFLNCQLCICPVNNTFGLKFKMATALSYGTPFLASPESMLCVPHLKDLPSISLKDPIQAAKTIVASILDEASTLNLAKKIAFQQSQFINSQTDIWSRSLNK